MLFIFLPQERTNGKCKKQRSYESYCCNYISIFFSKYKDEKSPIYIFKNYEKETHKCCEKKRRKTPKHYFRNSFFFMDLIFYFFQGLCFCLSLFYHKKSFKTVQNENFKQQIFAGLSMGRSVMEWSYHPPHGILE